MESKLKKQFPMGVRIGFSLQHCCKLTHTRSYYLAGPGWVVSVSGSPNRINKGFTVTQASLVAQWLKKKITCQCRRHMFDPWSREDPLEVEMATHSSILAWESPRDRETLRATVYEVPRVTYDRETKGQ